MTPLGVLVLGGLATLVVAGGLVLGRAWADDHVSVWAWLPVAALPVLVAGTSFAGVAAREEDVVASDAFGGLLVAWLLVLAPFFVCMGFGWAVGKLWTRPWPILAGLWLVFVVPMSFLVFLVALLVAAAIECPPDAYECPI